MWRAGIDGNFAEHDARILNPNASGFYIDNFKDAERDIIGAYLERKLTLSTNTGLELGARYNHASTDSAPNPADLNPMNLTSGMPFLLNNMVQMLANMHLGSPDPLQYANVDANYYGFDLEALLALNENFNLRSVVRVLRGQRDEISDDLYRISPDNFLLALEYRKNSFSASLETVTYADQDRVSNTSLEAKTDGYTLVNLSRRWNISPSLERGAGINNLLDERYDYHLSGYNRAYNPDIALGDRIPGLGRSVYGRMMWYF